MEQRQREQQDVSTSPPVLDLGAAAAPPGQVRVLAGADAQDMALGGRTVGDARIVAQAILGIDPHAVAVLNGEEVGEDRVLGDGQTLEFVKHSGTKGAARAVASTVELVGSRASWRRGGEVLAELSVRDLVMRLIGASSHREHWQLLPRFVRLMGTRAGGRVVGVVIEMPPGPRQVRWLASDSREPSGPNADYVSRRLSFPWVVLLVVFRDGEITGTQQAYYRTAPLTSLDDPLYLTNLLNVARGNDQISWVCLQNIGRHLKDLTWDRRIQAVTDHFWQAAFNRSADVSEQTGYHAFGGRIDARLATADTWEAATRAAPYFTLEVAWKRAPERLGECLESMLDLVVPHRPIESTDQMVTLIQQAGR